MQALKVLVVVMGILIVAGVAVVGVTIAKRAGEMAAPASASAAALEPFEPVTVTLPPTSRILGAAADSGRLVLQAEHADGSRGFVVLDLRTGQELGRITVKADGNP